MREPDLCLIETTCYEEAVACAKHYNALAARLTEVERQVNDCWCGVTSPMELLRGLRQLFPIATTDSAAVQESVKP